jgi:molybdate transport system permease protein
MDLAALWLSLQLAFWTTLILLLGGLPLAWWLVRTRWRGRVLVEAVVTLPLVLPPTVLGFYILMATGPRTPIGRAFESFTGGTIPFSFTGLLIGSVLFNLPFAVRPFSAALAAVNPRLLEASWCLGVSRLGTFRRIVVPLAWPGILAGMVLTFAHTLGEFGVVLMVGGNIPGVTRTISIAIYDDVQAMDYAAAGRSSLLLVLFALFALSITYTLQRRHVSL